MTKVEDVGKGDGYLKTLIEVNGRQYKLTEVEICWQRLKKVESCWLRLNEVN